MCMMIRGLVTGGPPHGALAIRWNNCIPGHQDGWIHTPPMAGRSRSSSAGDVAADHIPSLPRAAVALFITSRQPAEMDVMLRACLAAGIDLSLLYSSVRLYRVFCFVLLFVFPWRYAVQATSSDPSSMAVSTHPPTALHRTAPTVPGPAPPRPAPLSSGRRRAEDKIGGEANATAATAIDGAPCHPVPFPNKLLPAASRQSCPALLCYPFPHGVKKRPGAGPCKYHARYHTTHLMIDPSICMHASGQCGSWCACEGDGACSMCPPSHVFELRGWVGLGGVCMDAPLLLPKVAKGLGAN